ncbi:MAG: fluoride efflux transporter CrcB [Pseudomonadota bacterium]
MYHELKLLAAVGAGGAIGAIARFAVGRVCDQFWETGFPIATFAVNVVGSFAMGIFSYWLTTQSNSEVLRAFVAVGALGAFTTFSTFSLDVVNLYKDEMLLETAIYVTMSVCLSIIALIVGLTTAKHFLN